MLQILKVKQFVMLSFYFPPKTKNFKLKIKGKGDKVRVIFLTDYLIELLNN